ncbi:uncharacterized protein LOC127000955 [Eriocheir sinensis]|uniref:uncharacterized protein LOC127000955 n=1 Tax=Eriocheir sinensis TaxID=95602 RepID=UPI0021C6C00C|nr:uncharacterized protein LOC127000955 [Eriocheir sinensis]
MGASERREGLPAGVQAGSWPAPQPPPPETRSPPAPPSGGTHPAPPPAATPPAAPLEPPSFDTRASGNVTTLLGGTATLRCRVTNLENKTSVTLIILSFITLSMCSLTPLFPQVFPHAPFPRCSSPPYPRCSLTPPSTRCSLTPPVPRCTLTPPSPRCSLTPLPQVFLTPPPQVHPHAPTPRCTLTPQSPRCSLMPPSSQVFSHAPLPQVFPHAPLPQVFPHAPSPRCSLMPPPPRCSLTPPPPGAPHAPSPGVPSRPSPGVLTPPPMCSLTPPSRRCSLTLPFPQVFPHAPLPQVSWIRHRDLHLLSVGRFTYTSDQRFVARHSPATAAAAAAAPQEWLLIIHHLQERDAGLYECQISSTPPRSHLIHLAVVEPETAIVGGPDVYLNTGSQLALTCTIRFSPEPPAFILWYHGDKVGGEGGKKGWVDECMDG